MALADSHFVEPGQLGADAYVDSCLAVCAQYRPALFFPGRELEKLAKRSAEFEAIGTRVALAATEPTIDHLDHKGRFYESASGVVPVAEYRQYTTVNGFRTAWALLRPRFRVLCTKPCRSIFARGFRALRDDLDPFDELFRDPGYRLERSDFERRLETRSSFAPMILMPFLEGPEWSVDCLRLKDQTLITVPRCKLKDGEERVQAEPTLHALCSALSERFSLTGLFNVQFKHASADMASPPPVLEINPRAAGGVGLSTRCGVNLPWLAVCHYLDLPAAVPSGVRATSFTRQTGWTEVQQLPETVETAGPAESGPLASEHCLPTGRLFVEDGGGAWSLRRLIDVAARDNPRRGYLFVSRVLGKHLPVTPSRMLAAHDALAAQLPAQLATPVVFVGLAETATGLGAGLADAWMRRQGCTTAGQSPPLFWHTTRHPPAGATAFPFEESHSHAPAQYLCWPVDGEVEAQLLAVRTAVIVDDELSTGKTAVALARVLRQRLPQLESVLVATLVDLRPQAMLPGPARVGLDGVEDVVALGRGSHHFEPDSAWVAGRSTATGPYPLPDGVGLRRAGRLVRTSPWTLPDELLGAALNRIGGAARVVVFGTGECMHPALVLGRALELRGFQVTLQATTRSPILLGHAISAAARGTDPFEPDVAHFVYNATPGDDCAALFLAEPGAIGLASLVAAVGGHVLVVDDA